MNGSPENVFRRFPDTPGCAGSMTIGQAQQMLAAPSGRQLARFNGAEKPP